MKKLTSILLTLSFLAVPSFNVNAEELGKKFLDDSNKGKILSVNVFKPKGIPLACEVVYDFDGDGLQDGSEIYKVLPAPNENILPVGNPFYCWQDKNSNKILDKGEGFAPEDKPFIYWVDKSRDNVVDDEEKIYVIPDYLYFLDWMNKQ